MPEYQARYCSPASRDEPEDSDEWQEITEDQAIEITRLKWRNVQVRGKPVMLEAIGGGA